MPLDQCSEELTQFALFALDHAADSVIPRGGPLVPFALIDSGGERALKRFAGELEQGIALARHVVRETAGVSMAAVAWDGYLTLDGRRTDAVFVEASEAGSPVSVILAQRYASVGTIRKRMERVGNAGVVEYGSALF